MSPIRTKPSLSQDPGDSGSAVASVPAASGMAARAAAAVYSQIAETLRDRGLQIVQERIFGSLTSRNAVMATRAEVFLAHEMPPEGPVTYLQGNPPWGEGLSGVIHPCRQRGQTGRVPNAHRPRSALRSNVAQKRRAFSRTSKPRRSVRKPRVLRSLRRVQVRRMIERTDRILREHGASYRDVARTWFYLRDILAWYPQFNKVRNEKYGEFGMMPGPCDDVCFCLPARASGPK